MTVVNKVIDSTVHKVMCAFGKYPNGSGFHKGIDLCPKSTAETPDILAIADGEVIACCGTCTGKNTSNGVAGMGNYVSLKHGDGTWSRYQHLGSICVKKGQTVKKGQVIGNLGKAGTTTGNSTGRHLHLDISLPKKVSNCYASTYMSQTRYYVDPTSYLEGKSTIGSSATATTKTTTTTASYKTMTVSVKSKLNIRTTPSSSGKVVGYKKNGDKVTVYETRSGWARIGSNQWVSSSYLK